jgi:hypothetical protein
VWQKLHWTQWGDFFLNTEEFMEYFPGTIPEKTSINFNGFSSIGK